jgi:hypothetical protein
VHRLLQAQASTISPGHNRMPGCCAVGLTAPKVT